MFLRTVTAAAAWCRYDGKGITRSRRVVPRRHLVFISLYRCSQNIPLYAGTHGIMYNGGKERYISIAYCMVSLCAPGATKYHDFKINMIYNTDCMCNAAQREESSKKTLLVFYLLSRYAVYTSEMLIYMYSLCPKTFIAKALHEQRNEKRILKCERRKSLKPLKILRENKNAKAVREHLSLQLPTSDRFPISGNRRSWRKGARDSAVKSR